jgi:dTDP-N-acetylfucosamine:lipid II N-acetylfucosaminyltransferase
LFIHFLPDSIYSKTFIQYVHTNFTTQNHLFYVLSRQPLVHITCSDTVVRVSESSTLTYLLKIWKITRTKQCNKVFVHFLSDIHLLPILFARVVQKTYWILWGADLYSYINYPLYDRKTENLVSKFKTKSIKVKCLMELRKLAIKKLDYIAINNVEFDIIQKSYRIHAKRLDFIYPNPMNADISNQNIPAQKEYSIKKVVLLGNSGDPSNNHLDILEKLTQITIDFTVIVPLSYGSDKEYIKYIMRKGQELLGSRFNPLTQFLSTNAYNDLLSTVDVVIMNHYRQQAIGNLRVLISLGKKIYLNKYNPVYTYYSQEGIVINSLQDCSFDDSLFLANTSDVVNRNRDALKNIYNDQKVLTHMKCMFTKE